MKIKKEINEVKDDLKVAKKRFESIIKEEVRKAFLKIKDKDVYIDGYTLEDLTKKVLKKGYVTDKDKRYIYKSIMDLRSEGLTVIHLNRKYGFASTAEQRDQYDSIQASSIIGKTKSLYRMRRIDCERLGLPDRTKSFIADKLSDAGFNFLLEDKSTNDKVSNK